MRSWVIYKNCEIYNIFFFTWDTQQKVKKWDGLRYLVNGGVFVLTESRVRTLHTDVSGAGYGRREHIDANVPTVSLPSITRHGDASPHIPSQSYGCRPFSGAPTRFHYVQTSLHWTQPRFVHFLLNSSIFFTYSQSLTFSPSPLLG